MKLYLGYNGDYTQVEGDFDFDTAYSFAEAHGEAHDYSDEYEYRLTEENGQAYVLEADAWAEL
jgi:hypothetical protein